MAAVRMPPVLHVALEILVRRRSNELDAYQAVSLLMRRKGQQGERVLKLVAEAVRARSSGTSTCARASARR